jgi:hypothetical protein
VVQKSESIAPHIGFHAFLWIQLGCDILEISRFTIMSATCRDSQLANNGGFMKNA